MARATESPRVSLVRASSLRRAFPSSRSRSASCGRFPEVRRRAPQADRIHPTLAPALRPPRVRPVTTGFSHPARRSSTTPKEAFPPASERTDPDVPELRSSVLSSDQPHLAAVATEDVERQVDVLVGVGGSEARAEPRRVHRDGGVGVGTAGRSVTSAWPDRRRSMTAFRLLRLDGAGGKLRPWLERLDPRLNPRLRAPQHARGPLSRHSRLAHERSDPWHCWFERLAGIRSGRSMSRRSSRIS